MPFIHHNLAVSTIVKSANLCMLTIIIRFRRRGRQEVPQFPVHSIHTFGGNWSTQRRPLACGWTQDHQLAMLLSALKSCFLLFIGDGKKRKTQILAILPLLPIKKNFNTLTFLFNTFLFIFLIPIFSLPSATLRKFQEGLLPFLFSPGHCYHVFSLGSSSPFHSSYVHLTSVREAYSCGTTAPQKVASLSPHLVCAYISPNEMTWWIFPKP